MIESISNIDELFNIMFKSNSHHSHSQTASSDNGLKEKNSNSINILKNHEMNFHKRSSMNKNVLTKHANSMTLTDLTTTIRTLNHSEQMTAISSKTQTKPLGETISNRNNQILLLPHLVNVENKLVDASSNPNRHDSTTSTATATHFQLKSSILRKNSASLFKFTGK